MSVLVNKRFLLYLPFLCLAFLALTLERILKSAAGTAATTTTTTKRTNYSGSLLLMAQYTGSNNSYSTLLDLTQPINQAYAQVWGYGYISVSGYLIQAELEKAEPEQRNATIPESRATFNKVMLLEQVLTDETGRYKGYDKMLILDSDALMYDFSRDVASLLPADRVMVALKVRPRDADSTWNVNIGVTLWNLRHAATLPLVRSWKRACVKRILTQRHVRDCDQAPLHSVLQGIPVAERENLTLAVSDELGYRKGRLVRHFIRPDANNWTTHSSAMETRVAGIQQAVNEVCERTFNVTSYPDACSEYFHIHGKDDVVSS